ncbi:MAG: hypothetical protein R2762_10255 [Bryobacteraceae bacterium]
MLLLLALTIPAAGWIPARWHSSDPKSLELVQQTPINALLLEKQHWSPDFAKAAAARAILTLGVITPADAKVSPETIAAAGHSALVLEDLSPEAAAAIRATLPALPIVEIGSRTRMRLDTEDPILATNQGLWAGINTVEDGAAKAAPSGGPWIDTNSGFLRFVRAVTSTPLWLGNRPPESAVIPPARYLQAVGDAAMVGARWIVTLDAAFEKNLLAGDETALRNWRAIGDHIAFYEQHPEWRSFQPYSQLALVQDTASGGLFSGGILDMISVKHTPVRAVPARRLEEKDAMAGATMAVNVDPEAMTADQKQTLRQFTRAGGTLLTAPPGWKFPAQREGQITLDKEDVEKLDQIWKEVNAMTGRRNLGARLFNVSTMLSSLSAGPGGSPLVLQMVNYSDYPVEDITVHVLGKFKKAHLLAPGAPAREVEVYDNEEGTGIDIATVATVAALVIE